MQTNYSDFELAYGGGRAFSKSHRASLLKQENSNIKILRVKLESIHKAAGWIQLACPVQSQKAPSSVVGALFFLSAHPMPSFSSPPPFFFFWASSQIEQFLSFLSLTSKNKVWVNSCFRIFVPLNSAASNSLLLSSFTCCLPDALHPLGTPWTGTRRSDYQYLVLIPVEPSVEVIPDCTSRFVSAFVDLQEIKKGEGRVRG